MIKSMMICLFVLIQYANETDGHRAHDGIGHVAWRLCAAVTSDRLFCYFLFVLFVFFIFAAFDAE